MKRREVIVIIGCAALAWPISARAQQHTPMPLIGFLSARSEAGDAHLVAAFRQGLGEAGLVDGNDVAIDFRWADGHTDRLAALASDLIARKATLIVAAGGISAVAASRATSTIPIVFISTSDPLEYHLVASLSRPGGNVTGVSLAAVALAPKRIDLLLEMLPQARKLALLVNPTTATTAPAELRDVPAAAHERGRELKIVNATSEGDFEAAFATVVQAGVEGLVVGTDPLFVKARKQLVALAAQHRLPAIYDRREFTEAGGLMSYGTNIRAGYRRGGVYAGKVLKGTKPADLPVEEAATFELVLNLWTAKSLGLTVSQSLLSQAEEVIE